jgi:hypothetical protein
VRLASFSKAFSSAMPGVQKRQGGSTFVLVVEVRGFEPLASSVRERRGGSTTWKAGRREPLNWALAAHCCPVLSVTLAWDAPVWPRGPLGDHVLVLLLLVPARRTVGVSGGRAC